jgi:SAM-dependent methyltransferase
MSTDQEWVKWGRQDPYFAVITDEKYRSNKLTEAARQEFFNSGRYHVNYVLDHCRRLIDPAFAPSSALDFGCGVGRITLPLAEQVATVVGVDVSPDMLAEARRNCEQFGLTQVELLPSDDTLSAVQGGFDLVHSCITFQHIDMARGRRLFARLIELIAPGGLGAIQITYAKAAHADTFGQPPAPVPQAAQAARTVVLPGRRGVLKRLGMAAPQEPPADPEMQMNAYPLGELAFLLQSSGIQGFQAQFTDHGGELGVFLFFKKPALSPAST